MKQLKLHNGGHPLKNDNFDHLRDGVLDAFDGIVKGLSANYTETVIRLFGCEVNVVGNTATVSEGYLALKSVSTGQWEIYPVPAHNHTKASADSFTWGTEETYDAIDPQSYADGSNQNVHAVRVAKISSVSGTVVYPHTSPYLYELVAGELISVAYNSNNFSTNVGGTSWSVSNGNQSIKYKIDTDKKTATVYVSIDSSTLSNTDAEALIISLPAALTSKVDMVGSALTGDNAPVYSRVTAGGSDIYIRKYDASTFSDSLSVVEACITYELQ